MCGGVAKGTSSRKMKIEFGIACYQGHSAGHLKISSLVPFLTELLRVQLLETRFR